MPIRAMLLTLALTLNSIATSAEPPLVETRALTLDFSNYFGAARPTLIASFDRPADSMPTINSVAATDPRPLAHSSADSPQHSWQATYSFAGAAPAPVFALEWTSLDLLHYQSAVASVQTVRHAGDPKRIVRTPVVSAANAVVPLTTIGATLSQGEPFRTVEAALRSVFDPLREIVAPLQVSVRLDFCREIASAAAGAPPMMSRTPVVFLPATPVESAADIDRIVAGLADSFVKWADENIASAAGASLALRLSLCAGAWTHAPGMPLLAAEIELRLAGG